MTEHGGDRELRMQRELSEQYEADNERLRATIARVEALLVTTALGRAKPEPVHEHAVISAKALRAALKGP